MGSEALSATADNRFLATAKFVMDVGSRDRAFRGSDHNLIETANNIASSVQTRHRSLLVRIDLQGAVLITLRANRRGEACRSRADYDYVQICGLTVHK
jgi:hypothetical protein